MASESSKVHPINYEEERDDALKAASASNNDSPGQPTGASEGEEAEAKNQKKNLVADGKEKAIQFERTCQLAILDVFEDRVRIRCLNICAFLLVYTFLVLGLFHFAIVYGKRFREVEPFAAPPMNLITGLHPCGHALYNCTDFATTVMKSAGITITPRTMKAQSINDDASPRKGDQVVPYIMSFVGDSPIGCTTVELKKIQHTLEYERIKDVCSHTVTGSAQTNELGIGSIGDFKIDGPVGDYTLKAKIITKDHQTTHFSKGTQKTFTSTEVEDMRIVHPETLNALAAPAEVSTNQALPIQPAVRLRDSQGLPVSGIVVRVFANPDASWPPSGIRAKSVPTYNQKGQKVARLGCPFSEPSDSNGIARFTCLKVEWTTADHVNFIFTVGAFAFKPWNDKTFNPQQTYPLEPKFYLESTQLKTSVRQVEVVGQIPTTITEGENLSQVTVKVKDADGGPLTGVQCAALLTAEMGHELVLNFRRSVVGARRKELLNPISTPSDALGIATFGSLSFSTYGNVMSSPFPSSPVFKVGFVCDGVQSPSHAITISSKVVKIRIKRFLVTEAYVSKYGHPLSSGGDDTFQAIVRVIDANGNGVAGKSVSVVPVTTTPYFTPVVEANAEPTSPSGFALVPFRAMLLGYDSEDLLYERFQVKFIVDGVETVGSENITVRLREPPKNPECFAVTIDWLNLFSAAELPQGRQYFDAIPTVTSGNKVLIQAGVYGSVAHRYVTGDQQLQKNDFLNYPDYSWICGENMEYNQSGLVITSETDDCAPPAGCACELLEIYCRYNLGECQKEHFHGSTNLGTFIDWARTGQWPGASHRTTCCVPQRRLESVSTKPERRLEFSELAKVKFPVRRLQTSDPILPTTPGCYFRSPDGGTDKCPDIVRSWMLDIYGQEKTDAFSSQEACLSRKVSTDAFCGIDSLWYFVPASGGAVSTLSGCYFLQPTVGNSDCGPAVTTWTADTWGYANANSFSSFEACWSRKKRKDAFCKATSEWYFVPASEDEVVEDALRRLQKLAERRRLAEDNTEDLKLEVVQAYSTKGTELCFKDENGKEDCMLQVPYEPQLSYTQFIQGSLFTFPQSVDGLNTFPGKLYSFMQILGPTGTHHIRVKVTKKDNGTDQSCYSPIIPLNIDNPLRSIHFSEPYQEVPFNDRNGVIFEATFDFDDTILQKLGTTIPEKPLTTDLFGMVGAVVIGFVDLPVVWASAVGEELVTQLEMGPPSSAFTYRICQLNVTGTDCLPNGQSIDSRTMRVKIVMGDGIFGKFALQMMSRGMFSNVFVLNVQAPPTLKLSIKQNAGWSDTPSAKRLTQNPLPWNGQPAISVMSDGQPVEGVKLAARLIPQGDALAVKMSVVEYYDPFKFLISDPSNASGDATFPAFMLFDGDGCFRVQYAASEDPDHATDPADSNEICFKAATRLSVKSPPPGKLPLGKSLAEASGDSPFVVNLEFPYGDTFFSDPTNGIGLFFARAVVIPDNPGITSVLAQTYVLLSDSVCLWFGSKEIFSRCSKITQVQPGDKPIYQFTFLKLTWTRITEANQRIKMMPTDWSLTHLAAADDKIEAPSDWSNLSSSRQSLACVAALQKARKPLPTTAEIESDSKINSAVTVIPPPDVVEVSAMFLVRIRILTAGGGPVRYKKMRVGISPVAAVTPALSPASMLTTLALAGNTLKAFAKDDVKLDEAGVVQQSDARGYVSFPLSIMQATSGAYQLKFQGEDAGSQVLLSSSSFYVVNPIMDVYAEPWDEIAIEKFGEKIKIPKQPTFTIEISGGRSLQQMIDGGMYVKGVLMLKGASKKVLEKQEQLRNNAKKAMDFSAQQAKAYVDKKIESSQGKLAKSLTKQIGVSALDMALGRLTDDFQAKCKGTTMGGFQDAAKAVDVRSPTTADAFSEDSSVIDPSEYINQFIGMLTGGGMQMIPQAEFTLQMSVPVSYSDFKLIRSEVRTNDKAFVGTYEVTREMEYAFMAEGAEYKWELLLNGVSKKDSHTFKAIAPKPTKTETAVNWVMSVICTVVAVIVLSTNNTTNHWVWFLGAIPAVVFAMVIAPFLKGKKDAFGGFWPVFAEINLAFILIGLCWGLFIEKKKMCLGDKSNSKTSITFADRKATVMKEYTNRRLVKLIRLDTSEVNPWEVPLTKQIKQILRPLNSEIAFYYPSQFLAAVLCAFSMFGYVFVQVILIKDKIRKGLEALMNNNINTSLRMIASIETAFSSATGSDLPDSATKYIEKQLDIVRSWFMSLIDALSTGITVGIIIAFIFTLMSLLASFIDFRRRVLLCRAGHLTFKPKNARYAANGSFIGVFLAQTAVGFIVIVFVCTLVILPFHWNVLWETLWNTKWFLFTTFALMPIINAVSRVLINKFIYQGPHQIRFRWMAAGFYFYHSLTAIAAGPATAVTRAIFAFVSSILFLPVCFLPVTSEALNHIILLDASHKTYLAGVYMHHCFNHPVVVAFSNLLITSLKARQALTNDCLHISICDKAYAGRLKKTSLKKRSLILLLMAHPWLKKYRKAYLKQQADEAKKLKEEAQQMQKKRDESSQSKEDGMGTKANKSKAIIENENQLQTKRQELLDKRTEIDDEIKLLTEELQKLSSLKDK